MKRHVLSAMLLTCAIAANAQYKVNTTIVPAPNVQGSMTFGPGGSSVIVGDGFTNAPNNVIIGFATGPLVFPGVTGGGNTFVGQGTAGVNAAGYANTFLGNWVAGANTGGFANTFVGQYCGVANTTGYHNSFFGQGAGNSTTTGLHNVFIGTGSGNGNTSGVSNTALGASAGFASGGLINATTIGSNSQSAASNTVILGGTGSYAVNVGIGINAPTAHLHTVNPSAENVIFSTSSSFASSTLRMRTPSSPYPLNDVRLFMNASSLSGTFLPTIAANAAPSIADAHMAGLLTDGSPLAIGPDGYEIGKSGSLHFINWVANINGGYARTECMRINQKTGYVGVHTRQAATAASTGEPQALFHVNLTNPIKSNLNTLTNGIRFEGLPMATPTTHPDVIIVDGNGNLAKAVYPTGSGPSTAWQLTGNTTTGTQWIGTITGDDFRIRTNSTQRARFTLDGNFDLGTNSPSSSATSAAIGTSNTLSSATSAIAAGTGNQISNSDYSGALGESNIIGINSTSCQATGKNNNISSSSYSMAIGNNNTIDNSYASLAGGTGNRIDMSSTQIMVFGDGNRVTNNSYSSGIIGEDNDMLNAHGCFIGGGHSYSDGTYNLLLGNRLRASSAPMPMPGTTPLTFTSIMLIGEEIHSNLGRSLSIGFSSNRTSVTTQRGMAIQLNPTTTATYVPTVNFEVEASIGASSPMPFTGFGVRSNIRFHNLPPAPYPMPAVVVDPVSGELFQTSSTYLKQSNSPGVDLDSLYKENEALNTRLSELESKLAGYSEKFAALERSIKEICENGCDGLGAINNASGDKLYQSVPNPSDKDVMVNYYLSRNYTQATVSIYSLDGNNLSNFNLTPNKGNGSINISLAELEPGIYLYKLVVDGKAVGTKKLQKR